MSSAKLKSSKKRIAKKTARAKRSNKTVTVGPQSRLNVAIKNKDFLREAIRQARGPGKKQAMITIDEMVKAGDEVICQIIPSHALIQNYCRAVENNVVDAVVPEDIIEALDRSVVGLFEDVAALYTGRDIGLSVDEMSDVYIDMLNKSLLFTTDEFPKFYELIKSWEYKLDNALTEYREELLLRDDLPEHYNPTHEIQKERMAIVYPLYATPRAEGVV